MFRCRDCRTIFEEEQALSVNKYNSFRNILVCPKCECEEIENYYYDIDMLNYEIEHAEYEEEKVWFKELLKDFIEHKFGGV